MDKTKLKTKPVVKEESEEKIRWVNRGGKFYMAPKEGTKERRLILPGKSFMAYPSEIPKAFRNTIKPVNAMVDDEDEIDKNESEYKIVAAKKDPGLFNVINIETRKKVNDEPLSKKEAKAVLVKLQG